MRVGVGVGTGFGRSASGAGVGEIITQTVAPTFGPYASGGTPAGAYIDGTYASTAGTISSVVESFTINAVSALGSATLVAGDVVGLTVLVTDSAANTQTFGYGTLAVPATAPAAFTVGQWALDDSPSVTGNTLSVNIATLPFNGASAITALQYRVNGGTAVDLGGVGTGVRSITVPALASATVEIRAVNSVGNGAWSDVKELTPSAIAVVPSTITAGQWTLADSPSAGGDTLTLNITELPFDGYSAITALQFRRNGGVASTLSGLGTGARQITVLAGAASDIQVRAVNAIGNGEWSDTKSATPTVAVSGSIPFGAKTKSGAGGVATTGASISSGDASGHWTITGGFVVPSATGDTADLNAGPYTLTFNDASTMTISILPNAYSVRTIDEVSAAGQDAALALGDEILFRAGAYNSAYADKRITRTTLPSGTWSGSNYVVFKPHDGAVVDLHRLDLYGTTVQNCYFEFTGFRLVAGGANATIGCFGMRNSASYIYIHDTTSNTSDPGPTDITGLSNYVYYVGENNGAGNIRIENNSWDNAFNTIVASGNDMVIKGNTFRNAYNDFIKIVPPCSRMQAIGNIATDKQASYSPRTITAITRGTTTQVTVTDASGINPGDDVYFVGLTGCEGLIGSKYNINSIAGNVLTVAANSSGFTPWVSGGTARVSGVHGDFFQVLGGTAVDGELDDFIIRGNQFTRGAGTAGDVEGQGIFLADTGEDVYYRNALIEGNIIENTMVNGIVVSNPLNITVRNNVVVRKLGHNISGSTSIVFSGVGTGNECFDNVSNNYIFGATVFNSLNNRILTKDDAAAYAAAFDAPPTGEEQAVASVAYAPKAGGPLATAVPIQGAVPYQSFVDPWTYLDPRETPVIIGILGQSQPEYLLDPGAIYRQITQPTITAENVRIIQQSGNAPSLGAITDRLVTAAAVSAGQVNPWVANLSVWLSTVRPGKEVIIVDLCEPGTGRGELMNDAATGRNWSDLVAMVDYVRATYGEIDHVVECWQVNDVSTAKTHCLEWAPFYAGQRFGGGTFTLGTANPDSVVNSGVTVDHCLWDAAANAAEFGRGLFKRAETKLHLVGWPTVNDASSVAEALNFSTNSTGGTLPRHSSLDRPAKDQYLAFHDWAVSLGFGGNFGPSSHVADMVGGVHPDRTIPDGQILMGWPYAVSIANILGANVSEPVISSASYAFDGTFAEFTVTGPAGGYLTTLRAFRGEAAPTVEPPHYQPVVGFEIKRIGDTDAQRRPVWKLSETSRGANYRGTVTIAGANKIRVTPEVPFTNGDVIEFLRGDGSATLLEPRDIDADLYKNFPIWHVPSLYDAGALYPLQGIPVRPQPPAFTVSLVAISEMTNTVTSNLATWDGDPVDTNVVASDLAEWN